MTKSEFLAQENVPESIKAIVASLPGDADVEIESFKLGKPRNGRPAAPFRRGGDAGYHR